MPEVAVNPVPFFIVIAIYIGVLAVIGIIATRQTNTMQDYFVLSGKAGFIVTGIAYATTQYSMGTFLGTPGTIYNIGYAGMAISVPGMAFSMIIPAFLVGRKLVTLGHREGFLTLTDYLSDRYESKNMSGLLGLLMVIFMVPMMGAQIIGAGVLVNVFTGLPNNVGVIAFGAVVVTYCMTGGMRGAMMTDVIQGVLMLGAAIAAFAICLSAGGGLSALNSSLASMGDEWMSFPGANGAMPWTFMISNVMMWSLFNIGQPPLFTKFFAMKDHKTMFRSVILGTTGMMITAGLMNWIGVLARPVVGEISNPDYIVPIILQRGLPAIAACVLVAGIAAAGMSTIDGVLVTATAAVTRDIYQKFINPKATDDHVLKLSKYVTVVLGIMVVIFGCTKPGSIFTINAFAAAGLSMFMVPVLFGMYWKKATRPAAWAAIICGEIALISFTMVPSMKAAIHGFHATVPAAAIACVVMVIVSLATSGNAISERTLKRHMLVK